MKKIMFAFALTSLVACGNDSTISNVKEASIEGLPIVDPFVGTYDVSCTIPNPEVANHTRTVDGRVTATLTPIDGVETQTVSGRLSFLDMAADGSINVSQVDRVVAGQWSRLSERDGSESIGFDLMIPQRDDHGISDIRLQGFSTWRSSFKYRNALMSLTCQVTKVQQ